MTTAVRSFLVASLVAVSVAGLVTPAESMAQDTGAKVGRVIDDSVITGKVKAALIADAEFAWFHECDVGFIQPHFCCQITAPYEHTGRFPQQRRVDQEFKSLSFQYQCIHAATMHWMAGQVDRYFGRRWQVPENAYFDCLNPQPTRPV